MNNLEALIEAVKAAMTAKSALDQRIAENDSNWQRTSNLIKDAWTKLGLKPNQFKVGQAVFTCGIDGITQDAQFVGARNPKVLVELQVSIKDFLDRIRLGYDKKMQP